MRSFRWKRSARRSSACSPAASMKHPCSDHGGVSTDCASIYVGMGVGVTSFTRMLSPPLTINDHYFFSIIFYFVFFSIIINFSTFPPMCIHRKVITTATMLTTWQRWKHGAASSTSTMSSAGGSTNVKKQSKPVTYNGKRLWMSSVSGGSW